MCYLFTSFLPTMHPFISSLPGHAGVHGKEAAPKGTAWSRGSDSASYQPLQRWIFC